MLITAFTYMDWKEFPLHKKVIQNKRKRCVKNPIFTHRKIECTFFFFFQKLDPANRKTITTRVRPRKKEKRVTTYANNAENTLTGRCNRIVQKEARAVNTGWIFFFSSLRFLLCYSGVCQSIALLPSRMYKSISVLSFYFYFFFWDVISMIHTASRCVM